MQQFTPSFSDDPMHERETSLPIERRPAAYDKRIHLLIPTIEEALMIPEDSIKPAAGIAHIAQTAFQPGNVVQRPEAAPSNVVSIDSRTYLAEQTEPAPKAADNDLDIDDIRAQIRAA